MDGHSASDGRHLHYGGACRVANGRGTFDVNGWDALKSYQHKRNVVVSTAPALDDWFAGGERYG